jgi:hypothetical protein
MKNVIIASVALLAVSNGYTQKTNKLIKVKEVTRIEKILSADDMEGRATFTPGIEKAAAFIASEMAKAGLQPFKGATGYLQSFTMFEGNTTQAKATIGGVAEEASHISCFSQATSLTIDEKSGYKLVRIKAGDKFMNIARPLLNAKENTIVLVDTSLQAGFKNLRYFKGAQFPKTQNVVFVLTPNAEAETYSVKIEQTITEKKLSNVVGVLPGKSKADEYVVFSGHYDHLGYGKPDAKGDSLYNGANDDAAGTTAVLALAKYYKKLGNNERTLIFATFTAEEVGGFGSRYFSEQLDPSKVMAMFNIEMIGTESKWGKNSAYITGYEKTDMAKILEKNLEGTQFKFYPDPYTDQQLFYRSDNATLARLGVPAHTISTSKMDIEPHYHKASDEIGTLDMKNMTEVIKAIAISARTIVAGTDSPTRVDTSTLR